MKCLVVTKAIPFLVLTGFVSCLIMEGALAVDTVSNEESPIPEEAPVTAPGEEPKRPTATPKPDTDPPPAPALPESLRRSVQRAERISGAPAATWPEAPKPFAEAPAYPASQDVAEAMTQSQNPNMRQQALESTQVIDPTQLMPAWNALADPNPDTRSLAVEHLSQAPGEAVAQLVVEHLNGPHSAQWAQALEESLATLRPSLETPLLDLLQAGDRSLSEQRIAVWALGRMGSLAALPMLTKGAWSLEPALVEECVYALEALRSTTTIPVWSELTQHELYPVREIAVRNLNTLGGPEAYDALAGLAIGQMPVDPNLQIAAVQGLTQWPAEDIVPLLLEVMEYNPNTRRAVGGYFRQLTGADLPDMSLQWKAFFYGSPDAVPQPTTPQSNGTGSELIDNVPLVPPGFQPGF